MTKYALLSSICIMLLGLYFEAHVALVGISLASVLAGFFVVSVYIAENYNLKPMYWEPPSKGYMSFLFLAVSVGTFTVLIILIGVVAALVKYA